MPFIPGGSESIRSARFIMTEPLHEKQPGNSQAAVQCKPVQIRMGRIRYANTLPFFHRLGEKIHRDAHAAYSVQYVDDSPAGLNEAMLQGKIDIAPISSLAYYSHHQDFFLLPDLAIAARDFSGSVLLLSHEKIEGLNNTKIALSAESWSSSALLKILLKFKYKFQNEFAAVPSEPDEMLQRHKAALVIGDDALFFHPREFVYKYDLSELWWNWTAKPFCFALWAVRREFAEKHGKEIADLARMVMENRDRNLADIEMLLKESQGLSFTDERFSKLFGYLFNLHYGLDPAIQEGLELFYRLFERFSGQARPKSLEFFKYEC
jgi:chorismate dehydratase